MPEDSSTYRCCGRFYIPTNIPYMKMRNQLEREVQIKMVDMCRSRTVTKNKRMGEYNFLIKNLRNVKPMPFAKKMTTLINLYLKKDTKIINPENKKPLLHNIGEQKNIADNKCEPPLVDLMFSLMQQLKKNQSSSSEEQSCNNEENLQINEKNTIVSSEKKESDFEISKNEDLKTDCIAEEALQCESHTENVTLFFNDDEPAVESHNYVVASILESQSQFKGSEDCPIRKEICNETIEPTSANNNSIDNTEILKKRLEENLKRRKNSPASFNTNEFTTPNNRNNDAFFKTSNLNNSINCDQTENPRSLGMHQELGEVACFDDLQNNAVYVSENPQKIYNREKSSVHETVKSFVEISNVNVEDKESCSESNFGMEEDFSSDLSTRSEKEENTIEEAEGVSLQEAVENFLKSHTSSERMFVNSLKKGLCLEWINNSLSCEVSGCASSHNPRELFGKRLKRIRSKSILTLMVEMRQDRFFVDLLIEGFQELKRRSVGKKWLSFVVFFAFYVTDPFDQKFLVFWTNAASCFCELNESDDAIDGFAHLLKIFREIDASKEGKIIDFIKVLKSPPLEIEISWKLLQPIFLFKIPPQLLMDAIETCNKSKTHITNVLEDIIPKIEIQNLSVRGVETLLEFCKTLEEHGEEEMCLNLKRRLIKKMSAFEAPVDSEYPLTSSYQSELLARRKDNAIEEAELDFNESFPLDRDHAWTPFPKYSFNPGFSLSRSVLSTGFKKRTDYDGEIRRGKGKRRKYDETPETSYPGRINDLLRRLERNDFRLVGISLNQFSSRDLKKASEEIVMAILQTTISPTEVVDLIETIISTCETKIAAEIIASISMTMIYNFVKIPEWRTAYSILSLCIEKEIDLISGKIFTSNPSEELNDFRKSLLLVEVCLSNEKLSEAHRLLDKYRLFSSNSSLSINEVDAQLRVNLLNDYFSQVIDKHMTALVSDSFGKIWEAQRRLDGHFDLRKYANEHLILLLNEGSEDAFNQFLRISNQVLLKELTIRSLLVTLMRKREMRQAKIVLEKYALSIYNFPQVDLAPKTIGVSSAWAEEELLLIFDFFFEKLSRLSVIDQLKAKILIKESRPLTDSKINASNLSLIDTSVPGVKIRIAKVLQELLFPHLIVLSLSFNTLVIDSESLMEHLKYRLQHF